MYIKLIRHPLHNEYWISEDGQHVFKKLTNSVDSGGYVQQLQTNIMAIK